MPVLSVTTRALRPQAIAAASTRGAMLAGQGYTCEFCEVFPEAFTITKPAQDGDEPTQYKGWLPGGMLQFPEGKCDCQQWGKEGVCKHVYFAMEEAHNYARWEAEALRCEEAAAYAAACVGAGAFDKRGPAMLDCDVISDQIDAAAMAALPVFVLPAPAMDWATLPATSCPACGRHGYSKQTGCDDDDCRYYPVHQVRHDYGNADIL